MQINIDGHHVEVTDALRQYVKEKIGRLERHFDHVTNVHVVLKVERHVQKAECEMHASGTQIFAEATGDDMYAAIDALVDKLDRQILKHKEKLKDHHRRESPKRDQVAES
ncbi:MAG TPA: ribosome-associated translation inhibitor RaiA [Chromatiales bacterium]|nr:ribosome-associated translation inhibitor RaiA [Chromatiales bacterium]